MTRARYYHAELSRLDKIRRIKLLPTLNGGCHSFLVTAIVNCAGLVHDGLNAH